MREQTPGNPPAAPVRPTSPRRSQSIPVSGDLRKRYLAVGLIVGAAWAWHRGPLWLHVVSLVTVVVVVIPVTHLVRTRRGSPGDGDDSHRPRALPARLLTAKLLLVAAATAATLLLDPVTPHAELFVGLGIAVIVSVLGPLMHHALVPPRPSS